jgi:hypothetical protein
MLSKVLKRKRSTNGRWSLDRRFAVFSSASQKLVRFADHDTGQSLKKFGDPRNSRNFAVASDA